MSTNKGAKYITLDEGVDFRTIATKMTGMGYQMNHATARNVLLAGMVKFLQNIAEEFGQSLSQEVARQLAATQDIHNVLADVLELCAEEQRKQLSKTR